MWGRYRHAPLFAPQKNVHMSLQSGRLTKIPTLAEADFVRGFGDLVRQGLVIALAVIMGEVSGYGLPLAMSFQLDVHPILLTGKAYGQGRRPRLSKAPCHNSCRRNYFEFDSIF